jgi:hypothetical protein
VKSSTRASLISVPNGAKTTLATLDVTFPADGQGLVFTQCEWSNATAGNYVNCDLNETAGGVQTGIVNFDWEPGDVDGLYDQMQTYTWHKAVTAGGPKTYKLACNTSVGTASTFYCQAIVQFFPTLLP